MYYLGIDLGGTNIAAGLLNDEKTLICKASLPTPATDPVAVVDSMAALCRRLVEKEGISFDEVAYVGVACPGMVDREEGIVVYTPNVAFDNFPLARALCDRIPIKQVYLENDANAAALGEAVAGCARGKKNVVMITLGTGVGGGIIIDGHIYRGHNGEAGELGHMVIERNGIPCPCGRRGCLEAYASATALIRMTKEKMAKRPDSMMHEIAKKYGRVSGKTAFDAERADDEAGAEVVSAYISYLACGITNIINIFQPETVVIGGGICHERDNLLNRLFPLVRKEAYGSGRIQTAELRIAELSGDAGIVGAACLGLA